ncbi:MAG: aldo/keto reductase [Halobacteria archaeon]|nr:aldo/keto reductase [Halobacteria archaeon]
MPVNEIPRLGIGTWQNEDPEQCAKSVETALEIGYRHVDTAQAYGNEEAVGDGIARADVNRDNIFLATKVWTSELSYDDVLRSTEKSLKRLGVDTVDILYVHWPSGEYDAEETLGALNELYDEGKTRRIGVSNFTPEHLEEAIEVSDAPIAANQIEMHPLLQQREMVEFAGERDVEVVAYSPLARGKIFEVDELNEIAEKHGVSEAQISLAWLMEKGVHPIPKATSESHIRDNYGALELELDDEDVEKIDSINRTNRLIDPDFAPAW